MTNLIYHPRTEPIIRLTTTTTTTIKTTSERPLTQTKRLFQHPYLDKTYIGITGRLVCFHVRGCDSVDMSGTATAPIDY